jgi:poly-gamma-glutamate capsule biosynthesis protein CapA/YwtB (metallophosphatase superfamily)
VTITLALAGDTMLGRGVAEVVASSPTAPVADEVADLTRRADLFVLNLECCISERGHPWPAPSKPFHFRAPPAAVETLAHLGVDCVTLANNHALDFGHDALLDTLALLDEAGIAHVGAGPTLAAARAPQVLRAGDARVTVLAVSDHPRDFAAGPDRPGIAYANLWNGQRPAWLVDAIETHAGAGAVLVSPHWGPNMTPEPVAHVRLAARALVDAGATLVAGHSAHVFHGMAGRVLYDLGDFVDDYATDPALRNDLGLLFLVTLDATGPRHLEAFPLKLDYCRTRLAGGDDAHWIAQRFRGACAAMGTDVREEDGRLLVDLTG